MIFSIIIPVYNSENYLIECLNSVINQLYTNLEIILINDGSTDKSLEICEDYASRDKRISVLSQSNKGQASARNLGLQHCTGDYVLFVDSDDAISLDLIQLNYDILKCKTVDCLQFPVIMNFSSKDDERLLFDKYENLYLTSKVEILNHWLNEVNISWIVCNKIIKKDIALRIQFVEKMIYEDNKYVVDLIKEIENIFLSNKGSYHYYQRLNSTTTSKLTLKKEIDTIKVLDSLLSTFGSMLDNHLYVNYVLRIVNIEKSIKKNFKQSIKKSKKYTSFISFKYIFLDSKLALKDKIKLLMVKGNFIKDEI
ncbi:glycosyltransferase family 2 protein [Flavobacterium commune]|uniref:Glycosyltransferase 2-like domain-containing protein n=1 Tax=Flavobacterium commune TaxID=1306519 RepID=A0A1D9P7H3_9FLAO|nr:glycosyltransferase family A protein [Flavobacterium commune]AOZ98546.1 hypothetical protein BIW12_03355 [Flavobacterium commune]